MSQHYWRRQANRRVRKARITRSLLRWAGVMAMELTIAGGLLWAGVEIVRHVTDNEDFKLARIEIEGARRASIPEIRSRLQPFLGRTLFALDLHDVVETAEQEPWTLHATVKRIFPDTLRVSVVERVPCARARIDGRMWVVDTLGYAVAPTDEITAELPLLTGLNRDSHDALIASLAHGARVVRRLSDEAAVWLAEIAQLDLSEDDRIAVRTGDLAPVILLDRFQITRNLEQYLELRHDIARRYGAVDYVDLRWRDRISIKPRSLS